MKSNLIKEYLSLTAACANTDYTKAESVKTHNASVQRMYEIVEEFRPDVELGCKKEIDVLLNISSNKTNLWAATQVLEKLNVDEDTKQKALNIIKLEATGNTPEAIGCRLWLKDWGNLGS